MFVIVNVLVFAIDLPHLKKKKEEDVAVDVESHGDGVEGVRGRT